MAAYIRAGTALVVCAPSGAGKTTLVKRLLEKYGRLSFSVSCTTRPPRPGEKDGRDYYFMDRPCFMRLVEEEYFAEWAEVHGNYYGTPLKAARDLLSRGRDLLFDLDVQGAGQMKKSMPEASFVFILPPSRVELERRLRERGSESEADLALRLFNAANEIREAGWFDSWIVNDDMDEAFDDLCAVYKSACLSPARRHDFLLKLLKEF